MSPSSPCGVWRRGCEWKTGVTSSREPVPGHASGLLLRSSRLPLALGRAKARQCRRDGGVPRMSGPVAAASPWARQRPAGSVASEARQCRRDGGVPRMSGPVAAASPWARQRPAGSWGSEARQCRRDGGVPRISGPLALRRRHAGTSRVTRFSRSKQAECKHLGPSPPSASWPASPYP